MIFNLFFQNIFFCPWFFFVFLNFLCYFLDFSTICFCHKNINFHNKNCDKTNSTFRRSWRYEKQENRVSTAAPLKFFPCLWFWRVVCSIERRPSAAKAGLQWLMTLLNVRTIVPRLKTLTLLPLFFSRSGVFKNNSEKQEKFFVPFLPWVVLMVLMVNEVSKMPKDFFFLSLFFFCVTWYNLLWCNKYLPIIMRKEKIPGL